MDKFCFILAYSSKVIIDFCKVGSDRFQFLRSVLSNENDDIKEDIKINLSKEKLRKQIILLLNKRISEKNEIDFGSRFDDKHLYEIVVFDGSVIWLRTSGFDNLIIFGINIYNNIDSDLMIKYSKYKKLR